MVLMVYLQPHGTTLGCVCACVCVCVCWGGGETIHMLHVEEMQPGDTSLCENKRVTTA